MEDPSEETCNTDPLDGWGSLLPRLSPNRRLRHSEWTNSLNIFLQVNAYDDNVDNVL